MIYEFYRGRRDLVLYGILCLSAGAAVFHAIHSLAWLRSYSGATFDAWIVAVICIASIMAILLAAQIKRLPLSPRLVISVGGITYPLYLLHQQIGYTLFVRMAPANAKLGVTAIILGIGFASWILWRYVERPLQRIIRSHLTGWAARLGMAVKTGVGRAFQCLSWTAYWNTLDFFTHSCGHRTLAAATIRLAWRN